MTSVDEANGNVTVIFQQFYALVLIKELGLDHNITSTNKTYILVHKLITTLPLVTLHVYEIYLIW